MAAIAMSSGYYLICIDCNRGVNLSNSVSIMYNRSVSVETFGFESLTEIENPWRPDIDGCGILQNFLMLHRGHELRVLPSNVNQYGKGGDIPFVFPTSDDDPDPEFHLSTFFNKIAPPPDPDKELNEIPDDLRERLGNLRQE